MKKKARLPKGLRKTKKGWQADLRVVRTESGYRLPKVSIVAEHLRREDGERIREFLFEDEDHRFLSRAKDALDDIRCKLREGTWLPARAIVAGRIETSITFEKYIATKMLRVDHLAKIATKRWRTEDGGTFTLATMEIRSITPEDIERYSALRKADTRRIDGKRISSSTHAKNLDFLGQVFKHAHDRGFVAKNPMSVVKRPKKNPGRIEWLQREEFDALVREAEGTVAMLADGHRYPAPWVAQTYRLAVVTGFRLGEVLGLRWADVDFDQGRIFVNPNGSKTRRGCDSVAMSNAAREVLQERLATRMDEAGFVFVNTDGSSLFTPAWRNKLTQFAKRHLHAIGRPDCSFHTLRHTCCSWLIQSGADLVEVSHFMRHKNIQTTMRYAHLAPGHQVGLANMLDARLQLGPSPEQNLKLVSSR